MIGLSFILCLGEEIISSAEYICLPQYIDLSGRLHTILLTSETIVIQIAITSEGDSGHLHVEGDACNQATFFPSCSS